MRFKRLEPDAQADSEGKESSDHDAAQLAGQPAVVCLDEYGGEGHKEDNEHKDRVGQRG